MHTVSSVIVVVVVVAVVVAKVVVVVVVVLCGEQEGTWMHPHAVWVYPHVVWVYRHVGTPAGWLVAEGGQEGGAGRYSDPLLQYAP